MKRYAGLVIGILLTAPFAVAGMYGLFHPPWGLAHWSGWALEALFAVATLMFVVVTLQYLRELLRRLFHGAEPDGSHGKDNRNAA